MQEAIQARSLSKRKGISCILLICFLFVLFIPVSTYAKEEEHQKIRVAYPIQEGLTDIDENGNYFGYTYEYLRKLSQLTGWEYEFVQIPGDINSALIQMMEMLEKGEIDLMGNLLKYEDMEEKYDFAGSSYGMRYFTLTVLKTNSSLNEVNWSKVEDLHIGILESASKRKKQLSDFLKSNKSDAKILEYPSNIELKEALQKGEIDAVLDVDVSVQKDLKNIAKFGGEPYYFATTKGNAEVINALNVAMMQLESAEPYLQSRLYDKYFSTEKAEFMLSEQEKEYLKKKKELTVFIPSQIAPFQYNENGIEKGIIINLLEEFAKETSLTLNYKIWDEEKTLLEALEEEAYDFTLGVPYDYDYAEEYGMVLSNPYLTAQTTIFSKSPVDINNVTGKKLVLTRSATPMKEFEGADIVTVDTIKDCIEMVEREEADFGYANSYSVYYYLTRSAYPNVMSFPLYNKEKTFCCGFKSNTDMTLRILLNRFIEQKDANDIHAQLMEEIASVDRNLSFSDYIKLNPTKMMRIFIVSILVCVVFIFYFVKMKQEKEILKAQKEAQAHFLSNMSHEMRTPLNTIVGLNNLAEENIHDIEYVKDSMQKINTASEHLLQLINDILDMSKISEGKMQLQLKPFHLFAMMKSIDTVYQLAAKEKGVKLLLSMDERIYPYVKADELRLKQVLINLLLNGIKYNKSGGEVLVQAELLQSSKNEQEICFSVIDTGCGIEEKNQKRMFYAFEREERNESEGVQGTGLGLAISNEILKLMGSELKLESKVNQGSNFFFTLRLPIIEKEETAQLQITEKKDTQVDFSNVKFLLFEDNEINATIVKKLLEAKNGIVEIAENGKIGCDLFEQSPENYYHIILMDIRMPLMNGYDATIYIRSLSREDAKTIPIFALSANAFAEDVQKSKEVGMNEHLAKPIERERLFAMIGEYIQ